MNKNKYMDRRDIYRSLLICRDATRQSSKPKTTRPPTLTPVRPTLPLSIQEAVNSSEEVAYEREEIIERSASTKEENKNGERRSALSDPDLESSPPRIVKGSEERGT